MTSDILLGGMTAFLGGGAVAQGVTEGNWKDFVAGGAAAAVIFVVIVFLRHITEMRKEHSANLADEQKKHVDAIQAITMAQKAATDAFSLTVTAMARETHESHATYTKTLTDLLKPR